ncbi:uncharacterized protein LOC129791163 isoform X2 [Lutzomyia longipalpis]|uniref:uncharacterized protein LOC129791163 isoform X2 n=1 Tax=Lutzomyia longipalpis TaxID=7200 RepID=UPI002483401E|nr:uncharacterized protein LOC129791163 isoform X2 [Lutzomyia longipalpis]
MPPADRLVPIARKALPILRDLYKVDWPKHLINYQTINNFVNWYNQTSSIDEVFIWSLNDTWRDNGTFIIKSHYDIHCGTLDGNEETLVRAFCLINWNRPLLICSFVEYQRPPIVKALKIHKVPIKYDCSYKFFTLPKEKAKALPSVDLADDITIRRLGVREAEKANDLWPYKKDGSLTFLQKVAKYSMCYSAYTSSNELVGWIFTDTSGGIGTLHVVEEFRGRKIAQALVVKLCQHMGGTLKIDPHAFIVKTNFPSINLFEKLGFIESDELGYWIQTDAMEES